MRRNRPLFLFLLLACVAPAGLAQEAPAAPVSACPQVQVTSPDLVTAGDSLEITVTVTGGDPDVTPTYNWSVSDGAIESGQGTSTITVDTSAVASGFVTATVDVGGYARDCATASSSTTTIETKGGNEPAEDEPAPEKPPR